MVVNTNSTSVVIEESYAPVYGSLFFAQNLRSRQILRYDMDIHIRHVSQNFESNYDLEQIALDIKTLMHLVMLEVVGEVLARTIHES